MKFINLKYLYLIAVLISSGCATVGDTADPRDPLESYNRAAYDFNDGFDRYLLKPVAEGYDTITPQPIQRGVNNFFSNLDDIIVIVNDLLQLKPLQFASDSGRFIVNSTLGLAGFIDWASDMNMPKHEEDFGQTLGYWGMPSGPYFIIPFLGPSSIRDGTGLLVDGQISPIWQELESGFPVEARDTTAAISLRVIKGIDVRASLLKAENILNEAALDRYVFIREAYLQRRENLVYDGNPPEEPIEFNEDELFDFDDSPAPTKKSTIQDSSQP